MRLLTMDDVIIVFYLFWFLQLGSLEDEGFKLDLGMRSAGAIESCAVNHSETAE